MVIPSNFRPAVAGGGVVRPPLASPLWERAESAVQDICHEVSDRAPEDDGTDIDREACLEEIAELDAAHSKDYGVGWRRQGCNGSE